MPYVDLFAELPDKLPIKSVIVGPHPNQELQHHAIELLLDRFVVGGIERHALPDRRKSRHGADSGEHDL